MENKKNNTRFLTEAGIMLALTFILNSIKLYEFPQGGSITPGGYVPLIIFGFRWGWKKGMLLGGLYGLLDFAIGPYFLNIVQFLLDYPIAYAMLGLSGIFKKGVGSDTELGKLELIAGTVIATLMRMVSAIISGVAFFSQYLPKDKPYLLGSFLYNASYAIPNMIIAIILILIIYPRVGKKL